MSVIEITKQPTQNQRPPGQRTARGSLGVAAAIVCFLFSQVAQGHGDHGHEEQAKKKSNSPVKITFGVSVTKGFGSSSSAGSSGSGDDGGGS